VTVPLNGRLLGTNAGLGRKPPSVPITRKFVVPLPEGFAAAALIAGALMGLPIPFNVIPFGLPSSIYICKLRNRALQALRMRSRYRRASTVVSG